MKFQSTIKILVCPACGSDSISWEELPGGTAWDCPCGAMFETPTEKPAPCKGCGYADVVGSLTVGEIDKYSGHALYDLAGNYCSESCAIARIDREVADMGDWCED